MIDMKKLRKKAAVFAAVFLFLSCLKVSAAAGESQEEIPLHAQAACLMDGDSGRVLYGKEENLPLPMASTTKIMTCILVLESGKTEEMAQVSASGRPAESPSGRKKGETYRVWDLLYSLMLESHNDTAVVLAEHVGTTTEGFQK